VFPLLAKLLLLITVMAHAIFGCCLHHQHSANAANCRTSTNLPHPGCCAHRSRTEKPHNRSPQDSTPPAEHCTAEDCLFVDTRAELPQLASAISHGLPAIIDVPVATNALRPHHKSPVFAAHHCHGIALRIRLCCWLV